MTASRPRWNRAHGAAGLLQYVQPRAAEGLLEGPLPGPADGPPMDRARRLYEAFAAAGIRYVDEPVGSEPGRQEIRTPDQVLLRPRHATCLDLAVGYAGACLGAGLHPIVVLLDGERPERAAHALVLVWLGGDWDGAEAYDYPLLDVLEPGDVVYPVAPPELLGEVRATAEEPGAFLAVEVTGVASGGLSWEQAVRTGAELLRGGGGRWSAGVDVGVGYPQVDPFPLPGYPAGPVLVPSYLQLPYESAPLKQLSARHEVVAFHPRDELDLLLDWCQGADGGSPTRIALLHGVGGAGKTRLAAELGSRLADQGWHTGFLLRDADPADLAWLGRLASPLLVLVDYAEEARWEEVSRLLRALRGRRGPTCVVLTARSVSSWWHDGIADALEKEGHPYLLRDVPLTARHPRSAGVYRAALRAFGATPGVVLGGEPESYRWTTLDLVMLAWLAAHGAGTPPESEQALYMEVLRHELAYWRRAYRTQIGGKPPADLLRTAGACVSLLGPRRERLTAVLGAVEELAGAARWRTEIADLLVELLPAAPEDGSLAIRPDPVGAHLLAEVFGADEALLRRCFELADREERLNGCVALSRVGDGELSYRLAESALRGVPELWQPALVVASTQGGPFVAALETLAQVEDTLLPLALLRDLLAAGYVTTRRLAMIVATRLAPLSLGEEDGAARALWLVEFSIRQSEAGDHDGALESAQEAVVLLRRLAAGGASERRFHLAGALSQLGVAQAETGRRNAAVVSGRRAVALFRRLSGDEFPNRPWALAGALHNLSHHQGSVGDRGRALVTSRKAVELYRALAEGGAEQAVAALADALNGLSIRQVEAGELQQSVGTAVEAVEIARRLVAEDPTVHLPRLACGLNGLSNQLAAMGEPRRALLAITEVVEIRGKLVRLDPDAHLEDFLAAMVNLSVQRHANGDRTGAVQASHAVAELLRGLPDTGRFRLMLATTLQNLCHQLADIGDPAAAVTAADECIGLFRALAAESPEAFLPQLAAALSNRVAVQQTAGDPGGALTTAVEAVALYRGLAADFPEAFQPLLAVVLSILAGQQAYNGDRVGAHRTGQEAADLFSVLAERAPGVFGPRLAGALTNLSHHQRDVGLQREALASAERAVDLRRELVRADPAHLPELVSSLTALAASRTELGDLRGALSAEREAVESQRCLVAFDRAGHLVGLAGVVHNLALTLGRVGEQDQALNAAAEAVELQREVTDSNPVGGRATLAVLLNTLAIQQRGSGDDLSAHETSREAVRIQEQLAQANPGAFLPGLAMMLGTLANNEAAAGECTAALELARRSTEIRSRLAEAAPGVFGPELANAVENLAAHQARSGDLAGALESGTQAVELHRALAVAEPEAYRPDLARSLNNLAVVQAMSGALAEAVGSATEAVRISRELVLTDVEPYLPPLRKHLQLLLIQLVEHAGLPEVLRRSEQVIHGLPSEVRAQLLTERAQLRTRHGDATGAVADLAEAAHLIDAGGNPVRAGEVRRAVRGMLEELTESGTDLPPFPVWAELVTDVDARFYIDLWREQETWAEQAALARKIGDDLLYPALHDTLTVARAIHPEEGSLDLLADLLASAVEHGAAEAVRLFSIAHEQCQLIVGWLSLATWQEKYEYLRANPRLLTDPRIRTVLESRGDNPSARLHLAVLSLTDQLEPAEVHDAATDPAAAADVGITLLERGEPAALAALFTVAPLLREQTFTGAYLESVLLLPSAEAGRAADLMRSAAAQGSAVQREAGALRLRRLADRWPAAQDGLRKLGAILMEGR
ncbi:ATP-binding protein [Kitasatospora sp. MMS16-BH015]|uniref:tetratricopeptide repeat protein n=1 Tax=Kitasatospora sp. MMS16-BH015 TaxID=2018025 RepID=UPI000CA0B4D6|nr:tetratricopeptide repeat protein [Kitasatospora sp. MMS16-BH015]AUG76746.1 ATP-binding protein [Kitasatospora sp. MMS16-BH015]